MSEHSPKPWRKTPMTGRRNTRRIEILSGPYRVASVYLSDQKSLDADATLIAAAPNLLAAAKKVLADLNERIQTAEGPTPVFNGIAELHDAINEAEDTARATQRIREV